jgi:methylmalonyl-CoA mutase cobalamin-binding domain/chain
MSDRLHELREIAEDPGAIEIVPHTSATLRSAGVVAARRLPEAPSAQELDQFTGALLEAVLRDDGDIHDRVRDAMQAARVRIHDVIDHHLPEAARRLGQDWHDNRRSFADVTIGVARLQGLLRDLVAQSREDGVRDASAPGVAIVVMENEFHTLGAMVIGQQLRRMGVSVQMVIGQTEAEILQSVAQDHFDAIFVSVSRAECLASVRKLVEKLKNATVADTPVVIGGLAVSDEAEIRVLSGADHVATDARDAVQKCGLKISHRGASLRVSTS